MPPMTMRYRRFGVLNRSHAVLFVKSTAQEERMVALGGIGVSQRVVWIECEGPFQKYQCSLRWLRHSCEYVWLSV